MKLTPSSSRTRIRQRAWALLAVMSISAAGLMVLAGVMNWADQNSAVVERNNETFATSYAAEAATEKVLSTISQQFQNYGMNVVSSNMGIYQTILPTAADDNTGGDNYWTNYQFYGGTTPNTISVTVSPQQGTNVIVGGPYNGLTLVAYTNQIVATAVNMNSMYHIPATIGQQLYLGYIPLFQFAIFYQDTLEIEPNAPMTVNGPVHGNGDIYMAPSRGLTFNDSVTATGSVTQTNTATITWAPGAFELGSVDPLNVPVGTNTTGVVSNSSQNVHAILGLPQPGQTPTDSVGQNLLYNKADLIIIISNDNTISVTSGALVNNQATVISNSDWQTFMNTNGQFLDQRQSMTVNPVVIDVSNLLTWSATNTSLRPALATARGSSTLADVQSIYIDDERTSTNQVAVTTNTVTNITSAITTNYSYITNLSTNATYTIAPPPSPALGTFVLSSISAILGTNAGGPYIMDYKYLAIIKVVNTNILSVVTNYTTNTYASYYTNFLPVAVQPGIVLSNGSVLPPQGLSIATPDPAYIVGNWNVQNSTATGAPTDANSSDTSYTRPSAIYSDAVTILSSAWHPNESTLPLTSRIAVNDTVNAAFLTGNVPTAGSEYSGGVENLPRFLENWQNQTFTYNGSMVCMFASQVANASYPGTGTVFNPPTRTWAFDQNFSDPTKQPPLMPKAITVQRSQWVQLKPYASSF